MDHDASEDEIDARADITEPMQEGQPGTKNDEPPARNRCSLAWVCGQLGSLLGIFIASIIGAVVYAMFLQAILWQSLVLPGGIVDPADWKTKLSGTAWGLAAFSFFGLAASSAALTALPLPLRPGSSSAWYMSGFLLALFIIQLATVRYASLRPELCKVSRSDAFFYFCKVPAWWPSCCASQPVARRRLSVRRVTQAGLPSESEEPELAPLGGSTPGSASGPSSIAGASSRRPMRNGVFVRSRRSPSAPSVPLSHSARPAGGWGGEAEEVRPATGLGAAIVQVVFGGRVSNVFFSGHGSRPVPVTAERASIIAAHISSAASVHSAAGGSDIRPSGDTRSQHDWMRTSTRTPAVWESTGPSPSPSGKWRPPAHPEQPGFGSGFGSAVPGTPLTGGRHGAAPPHDGASAITVVTGRSALRRSYTLGSMPFAAALSSGMGSLQHDNEAPPSRVDPAHAIQSASGVPRFRARAPAPARKRAELSPGRYLCRSSMDLGSWRNYVQILVIVVELLQLVSLALGTDTRSTGRIRRVLPDDFLHACSVVRGVLWEGSGVALSHRQRVDVAYAVVRGFGIVYAMLCGVFIAMDLMARSWLAPILFSLLAGAGYVTVTSGTLFVIYASDSAGQIAVCCLVLLFYSSTAVFVSIYRGDATASGGFDEARIRPRFLAIERVLKGVLAVSFAVLAGDPPTRAWVVATILVLYAVLFLAAAPCNVVLLNVVRSGCIAVAAWSSVISALALTLEPPFDGSLSAPTADALSMALVWGTVAIAAMTLLLTNWTVVDSLDAATCGCFKHAMPCFRHRRGATAGAMTRAARVAPMP